MAHRKIKPQIPQQGKIGAEAVNLSFGFSYLHDTGYTDCKDVDFFINYLKRLKKLSSIGWNVVNTSQRHSFGWEKIPIQCIKKDISLTDDITFLMSFRATGDNHAFLGFREGNVFQVVFIESTFSDIYDHD